jgi:GntR family transcriptional regulator of vanillate catabolism
VRSLRDINDTIQAEVHRADYESFERYVELNERFHARILRMAASPMLERAVEGILSLPFAGPSAFVMTEAVLPESRDILIVAHHQHLGLIEAIEGGQGARAESLAREHALLALRNLEVVLSHPAALEHMPGGSLVALSGDGTG